MGMLMINSKKAFQLPFRHHMTTNIIVWHPKTPMVHPPPHCSRFLVLNGPGHCPLWFRTGPQKKSCPPTLHGPKSKMASKRLVWSDQLFSMGDKSKILFSTMGFLYPTQKNVFKVKGGLNVAWGHLTLFKVKKAIFQHFSWKPQIFSTLKIF